MYRILVLDSSECCYAVVYSDGEIKPILELQSYIPSKHKSGGQSAARFARAREGLIVQWYKRLNRHLKDIQGEFILGMNPVYYNNFISYMDTYNKQKVKEHRSTAYTDINGIYDMVNTLEREKKQNGN